MWLDSERGWGSHASGLTYATTPLTPWLVKERLEKIGQEKRRLHLLDSHCVPAIGRRDGLDDLKSACVKLLVKLNIAHDEKSQWTVLLYKVRNSVVHNQILLLKSNALEDLGEVNQSIRRAALDLLFSFEKPDDSVFFAD